MSQAAFAQIQQILESAVNGGTIGAHGNFWRNKTRDQFVTLKVFGRQLLVVGKADDSNLIKALRGETPFDGAVDAGAGERITIAAVASLGRLQAQQLREMSDSLSSSEV